MPEPSYKNEPFAPKAHSKFETFLPGIVYGDWVSQVLYEGVVHPDGPGWDGLRDAMDNQAFVLFDMDGNPTILNDPDYFRPMLASNSIPDYTNTQELIQASLEGRLCIRQKGSGDLIQVQTTLPPDYPNRNPNPDVSFSRPVKAFANLDPSVPAPVSEEPKKKKKEKKQEEKKQEEKQEKPLEEPMAKPQKPGLWTRIVAFFSPNSDAAKAVREYEEALQRYNEQKAAQNPKKEEAAPKKEEAAPKKEAAKNMKLGKAQQRDYDAVMVGLNYDSTSGLNLDTRNFGHSAGTGYLLADNHFKMGARNRKSILENLKDGKPIENLDARLKGVLWGGIIGRHLQGNGDASQFCMSFESPVQRAEMESKMMSTKAAKDLMAADSKKLMGILGSRTKFNKMLDDVITQMTKVKTTTKTSTQPTKKMEAGSANLFK